MLPSGVKIKFWGCRGSCPAWNKGISHFGSNSLCVSLQTDDEIVFFDAGTGICNVSESDFVLETGSIKRVYLFLSHYHMDHIVGLPFFKFLHNKNIEINIYGPKLLGKTCENWIDDIFKPAAHPLLIKEFAKAKLNFLDSCEGFMQIGKHITVNTFLLNHPGGSYGYRISHNEKNICYITDVELGKDKEHDECLSEFVKGSDALIIDSFFADKEIEAGWGHSSWNECCELAKNSEIKKLILFHHGLNVTDELIFEMEKNYNKRNKTEMIASELIAAFEGMEVLL